MYVYNIDLGFYFIFISVGGVYAHTQVPTGQKSVLDLLELELRTAVSHPTWALGSQLGPPQGATSMLNHWAACLYPFCFYCFAGMLRIKSQGLLRTKCCTIEL